MLKTSRKLIIVLALLLAAAGFFHFGHDALAQSVNTGIQFGAQTGLVNQDPRVTVTKVIRIGLGFLGVIAVGLIIYAGFLWMSAKGDEEKISQAKKILSSAAIGLGIIIASFAIASFILSRLLGATGGSGNGTSEGPGGGFGTGNDIFAVHGVVPAHKAVNVPRNVVIRADFTKPVRANSVTENTFIVHNEDGKAISGSRTVFSSVIEFAPSASCEAPNEDKKCFPASTSFILEIRNEQTVTDPSSGAMAATASLSGNEKGGIVSINNEKLSCSGSSRCIVQFTTGDYIDEEAPKVNLTTNQICASSDNTLRASAIDNYGVSKIDFFADDKLIGSQINNSNPFVGSPYNATQKWNPGAGTVGQTYILKATAYDLDSNGSSAEKSLKLSPDHCCNGVMDDDETGIDCGGSCIACADNDHPRIDSVTPVGGFCVSDINKACTQDGDCGTNSQCDLGTPNGASGNLLTISGHGFGSVPGKVYFGSGSQRVEAMLANDPESGNPQCGDRVWSESQVVVIVPERSANGPISIQTKTGEGDSTDDEYGPLLNNFKKNTISRPGLCQIDPGNAKTQDTISYEGLKLMAASAYFGNLSQNVPALSSNFRQAMTGSAQVPNLTTGETTTYVQNGKIASNYIAFTKDKDPYDGPIISALDPASGPIGQYVTLRGSGFGGSKGNSKVYFGDTTGKEADYSFPDICLPTIWKDNQVIVKVPAGIAQGSYKLTMVREGYAPVDSGSLTFQVTAGTPAPGLCRIDPVLGPANSAVNLWGEYFQNKSANSAVVFNGKDQVQTNTAIVFWDIDQNASGLKPWKVVTTVPQSAQSGPVRIRVGAPAQLSNSLNFAVGACTKDEDCGSGSTCCSAGLPEAGRCKSDSAQCYGNILKSVYEWQFTTGAGTASCPSDTTTCGSLCCAEGCDPANTNKCLGICDEGESQCADGSCCVGACEEGVNGGPSTCSDPDTSICATISDPVECSQNEECCVDGREGQNNKCVKASPGQPRVPASGFGTNPFAAIGSGTPPETMFCGFYKCVVNGGVNSCFNSVVKDGPYRLKTACQQGCVNDPIYCSGNKEQCSNPQCPTNMRCDMGSCTCVTNNPPPQEFCKNPLIQQCNNSCSAGYACLTPTANGAAAKAGDTTNNTCRCCCKPPTQQDPTDTCKDIDPGLSCLADQDACTGPDRGACCGCTHDAQCGDVVTTGCGQIASRCCRARPAVGNLDGSPARFPEPGTTNVCLNPAIEAFFNQRMDLTSFSGSGGPYTNVVLIGDYENSPCPSDSHPVSFEGAPSRVARLLLPFKKLIARLIPSSFTAEALADSSNYCIIAGSPIGSDVNSLQSKVSYRLTKQLDSNRTYYLVIQGDPELASVTPDNQKDYYDTKVRSLSKIGLAALQTRRPIGYIPAAFNGTKFPNADIWTFKTGSELCALDQVQVTPSFHLFQKAGETADLEAISLGRNQRINAIPGVYDWTWNWQSANSDVAALEPQADQPRYATARAGSKKDAQTVATATATITADTVLRPSTVGKQVKGSAQLRSFLCENPWPVYYSFMPPPGFSWPWKDDATGIEFYYCRDANGIGTADDLPAIKDAPLTPPGARKICMSGSNIGKTCTSDANCGNVANSCWPELLKEYFFFRENEPGIPNLSGTADPAGGKVSLQWQPSANASKYKIYYGTASRQYGWTIDIAGSPSEITRVIDGLVNNVDYYFTVTALTDKNQETAFSNEVKLRPRDTIAPAAPSLSASGAVGVGNDNRVSLFWNAVPEATSYIAYLGTRPRTGNDQYAQKQAVYTTPGPNGANYTFANLDANGTYYVAVKAVDAYGNMSDYSTEVQVRPNRPMLISGTSIRGGVALRWAPFIGNQGYVITVAGSGGGRSIPPISVGATTLEYQVSGLAAGEYSFTITAKKPNNQTSEASNELRASAR